MAHQHCKAAYVQTPTQSPADGLHSARRHSGLNKEMRLVIV